MRFFETLSFSVWRQDLALILRYFQEKAFRFCGRPAARAYGIDEKET